eukprot:gene10384-11465_t
MDAKWAIFEAKVKAKRDINCKGKRKKDVPAQKVDQLTVQRLSATVSGKAQRFSRIGPREFVPYPHGDSTLDGIKRACEDHFAARWKGEISCDVLAGKQGPSCNALDQVPSLKLIHVRLLSTTRSRYSGLHLNEELSSESIGRTFSSPIDVPPLEKKKCTRTGESSVLSSPEKTAVHLPDTDKPKAFPKSLSITQMLKLGKVVKNTTSIIKVYKFNLETMLWSSEAEKVDITIEEKPFANGGFREVYIARSQTVGYDHQTWVVKKYLPTTIQCIFDLHQNIKDYTKKTVQMQALAKNITENLGIAMKKHCKNVGGLFSYPECFIGILENDGCVTMEPFIAGEFRKYINNNGHSCGDTQTTIIGMKADCLVHYSYQKSNEQLMLLDIQGSNYSLFDPEIATPE